MTNDLHEFVARSLGEVEGKPLTVVVRIPVPQAPLSIFLRAVERDMSLLWDTGSPADAFAAAGATHRIDVSGLDRFAQLQRETSAIWKRTVVRTHPDCEAPPPRIFGGFAFAPGSASAAPWESFGDGYFALPRWCYSRNHGKPVLAVSARGEECDAAGREKLLVELDAILETLDAHRGLRTSTVVLLFPSIPQNDLLQLDYAVWQAHIEAVRDAIHGGGFAKLVAARRCDVELKRPLDEIEVLSRLTAEATCTRFAFRRKTASFIGASPETLFSKRGDVLVTHALAGTIRYMGSERPTVSSQSDQLLSSDKDLREHQFVVQEICRCLAPYAESMDVPPKPVVRKLRSILHLDTPIQARLRSGVDAAELVGALHPTPAVGGLPKQGAAEWIAAHEQHPRGWYSGPVGWVDLAGDATFVVAIRCGILTPEYAYVYTGAGIVADSEPSAEYEETELKQLPLLRAVGVVV